MAYFSFATISDLEEYAGFNDLPDNAQLLLTRANELVSITIRKNYNPNNQNHVTAAKNAVCAQVLSWVESNTSPFSDDDVSSYSLGDISVSKSSGTKKPTSLCSMSLAYLRDECLLYLGLRGGGTVQHV